MPPSHRLFAPLTALLIVAMAAVTMLAKPAPARASQDQLSIMMDDDLLLYRGDDVRDQALRKMASMGVDTVRVTVLWSVVAHGAKHGKKQRRRWAKYGAQNPKAYPKLNWDRYDRLVRATRILGLKAYFDVTFPGPPWAHHKPPRSERSNRRTWKPDERDFYDFVVAVGKRYGGSYRDENDGRQKIPRVFIWALGNEPNQGGWLTPQWEHGKLASPRLYRNLYLFGRRALERTGHGRDAIFVGETAPLGNDQHTSRSPVRPKAFIRQFLCEPGHTDSGCSAFDKYGPIQATAWAHHPYTKNISPLQRDPNPDSITMANIQELPSLLDQLAGETGHIASGLNVISTEFGFETNPPDPYSGISLDNQANWLTIGDYLTYLNPRVAGNTQFLLQDVPPLRNHTKGSKAYWFTYQSGLLTRKGNPKPSAQAYSFPFLAFRTGTTGPPAAETDPPEGQLIAAVWGQLRFRPDNLPDGFQDQVQLQYKPADGSADWGNVGNPIPVTNGRGYFTGNVVVPAAGKVRATWAGNTLPFVAASREYAVQ